MPVFAYEQILLVPETNFPIYSKIADFIRPIFDQLCIQNECLLMMLIYIERIISVGEVFLNKLNWRPITYTALLLAGKMQEDLVVTNQDYASIYPFFSLHSTNSLERQFTTALGWNLFISEDQYSNYFFKLQGMIHSGERTLLKKLSRQGTLRKESGTEEKN